MPIAVDAFPTVGEAAAALLSTPQARFFGGGTILMRALNEADPSIERIIRTADPALREMRSAGGSVTLGAHVTMAAVAHHRDTAFLAPVARVIGGPQVRSAATVAGNLFAAAPYGDFAAALMALGASAELADGRRIPVDDVIRNGARGIVASVIVPIPRDGLLFKKVSRVRPKGVSVLSIAAHLPRQSGRVNGARIVLNGMGPRPARASAAEAALNGRPLESSAIERAAQVAAEGFAPQDDPIATAWYRREVAGVHLRRLLEGAR
ncbi:MAG: FAD binding domain-containing protein [Pseudomonadota bacterium]